MQQGIKSVNVLSTTPLPPQPPPTHPSVPLPQRNESLPQGQKGWFAVQSTNRKTSADSICWFDFFLAKTSGFPQNYGSCGGRNIYYQYWLRLVPWYEIMHNQFRNLDVYYIKSCLISCLHRLFMRVKGCWVSHCFLYSHGLLWELLPVVVNISTCHILCVVYRVFKFTPPSLSPTFTLFSPCAKERRHNFCYFAVKCKLTSEATVIFILPKRIKTGFFHCAVLCLQSGGGRGGGNPEKLQVCVVIRVRVAGQENGPHLNHFAAMIITWKPPVRVHNLKSFSLFAFFFCIIMRKGFHETTQY